MSLKCSKQQKLLVLGIILISTTLWFSFHVFSVTNGDSALLSKFYAKEANPNHVIQISQQTHSQENTNKLNQSNKTIKISMDVAVVFSGLVRALRFSLDSLNKMIFDVMDDNKITYHKYMHSYLLSHEYTNRRNNINNIHINTSEYKLLNADFVLNDDQDTILKQLNVGKYRTNGDAWDNGFASTDNFILAMYSRYLITKKLMDNIVNFNYEYKYVMFIRSDVLFKQPLNINYLTEIQNGDRKRDVLVPEWDTGPRGTEGINDRWTLCAQEMGIQYGLEYERLYDFSLKYIMHAESFKKYVLDELDANVIRVPFYFGRVRANGNIAPGDCALLNETDKQKFECPNIAMHIIIIIIFIAVSITVCLTIIWSKRGSRNWFSFFFCKYIKYFIV